MGVCVCFGSTPTLRATVIPKPEARRRCSAFHLRGPRTGRQASAPAWCAGLRHPRRDSPGPSATRRKQVQPSAAQSSPLGRTPTAAEGLDPGALPMRWGDARMGLFRAGRISLGLPPRMWGKWAEAEGEARWGCVAFRRSDGGEFLDYVPPSTLRYAFGPLPPPAGEDPSASGPAARSVRRPCGAVRRGRRWPWRRRRSAQGGS